MIDDVRRLVEKTAPCINTMVSLFPEAELGHPGSPPPLEPRKPSSRMSLGGGRDPGGEHSRSTVHRIPALLAERSVGGRSAINQNEKIETKDRKIDHKLFVGRTEVSHTICFVDLVLFVCGCRTAGQKCRTLPAP